jgi:type IV pilus assembly protein PilC
MAMYQYTVRDKSGKLISSSMEAESRRAVVDALREKGYYIAEIKEPGSGFGAEIKIPGLGPRMPSLRDITIFSRQFSTMISSGLPVVQSLNILQKQTESKGLQNIIKEVRTDVEGGTPLSDAMAKHPRTFDGLYVNLVRAGEVSGSLETILDRVASFLEKNAELRGKIKGAMTYPTIVLIIALGITYFLLTTIVPQFAGLLTETGGDLPALTQGLIVVSNFVQNTGWMILVFIAIGVFAYRQIYRTPKGRYQIDKLKLRIPIFGNLIRKAAVASFSRTFSLLLRSGVNVVEALDITKGTANNAIVEEALNNAKLAVQKGEQISQPLAAVPEVFPPMVTSMIAIGEETGAIDSMLAKIADFYDREVDEAVEQLTAAIEPLLMVFLGGIVGTIVVGMFLPMFQIVQQV